MGAGIDPEQLRELVNHWRTDFDWREREAWLNSFPQFTTSINNARLHFVHVRSAVGDRPALPIILSHGWPYSFAEMLPIVPYLVDPEAHGGTPDDAFDVVIPSLPGFGFSEPLPDQPFTAAAVARVMNTLMTEVLGYEHYATYGEDVGTWASDATAALFPEKVVGLFATHAAFPPEARQHDLSEEEVAFKARLAEKWKNESAYSVMQSTKPDTFAASLSDSPAGLLALIAEKFHTWSGDDGGAMSTAIPQDDLLTTTMLYWVTNTIGSSFQPYFDDRYEPVAPEIDVPVGVAVQHGERGFPQTYAARTYRDIRVWNELPRGSHFTAKEAPDLVAAGMREFFRELH